MEVCIAHLHGKAVMLELKDGIVHIDGEPQPIKHVTEDEIREFSEAIQAIPYSVGPGYQALLNAKRCSFLVSLIGRAVGDDTVNHLSHILDHLHYDVLEFLGETDGEEEEHHCDCHGHDHG